MAVDATPLTNEERAELERLRAEKTERERSEQARRERAELEQLREEARTERPRTTEGDSLGGPPQTDSQRRPAAASAAESAAESERIAAARERGRKLMEPGDDLSMPTGQKIVLACVAIAVIVAVAMFVLMPR